MVLARLAVSLFGARTKRLPPPVVPCLARNSRGFDGGDDHEWFGQSEITTEAIGVIKVMVGEDDVHRITPGDWLGHAGSPLHTAGNVETVDHHHGTFTGDDSAVAQGEELIPFDDDGPDSATSPRVDGHQCGGRGIKLKWRLGGLALPPCVCSRR